MPRGASARRHARPWLASAAAPASAPPGWWSPPSRRPRRPSATACRRAGSSAVPASWPSNWLCGLAPALRRPDGGGSARNRGDQMAGQDVSQGRRAGSHMRTIFGFGANSGGQNKFGLSRLWQPGSATDSLVSCATTHAHANPRKETTCVAMTRPSTPNFGIANQLSWIGPTGGLPTARGRLRDTSRRTPTPMSALCERAQVVWVVRAAQGVYT